jgi:hypothetical protein
VINHEGREEDTHLKVSIHDNLLLISVLERLTPLDSPRQHTLQTPPLRLLPLFFVVRIDVDRIRGGKVPAGGDGGTALEAGDVASKDCKEGEGVSEEGKGENEGRDEPFIRTVSATSSALWPVTMWSTSRVCAPRSRA